jgi:hypothetical protein
MGLLPALPPRRWRRHTQPRESDRTGAAVQPIACGGRRDGGGRSVGGARPAVKTWRPRERHGLRDPNLDEYAQSLALFGLPLTEARMATNAAGDTVLTQWFERARFEWHPGNPDAFKVLLGLLGREVEPPFIAPCATPQGRDCPETHPIKGNINARGERIYHVPGSRYYDETIPEVCFLTVEEAEAAGFRPSQRYGRPTSGRSGVAARCARPAMRSLTVDGAGSPGYNALTESCEQRVPDRVSTIASP